MYNRLSINGWRLLRTSLTGTYKQINRSSSIFHCKYSTISASNYCHKFFDAKFKLTLCQNMGQQYATDASQINVPVVSFEEVKDLPNHPEKMLIDVREPDELKETGIIPTAINIPLGQVKTALDMSDRQFKAKYNRNKPDLSDEIIFHCKIGKRSENAAIIATKLGYTNAKNYLGSWMDWAERQGLPK